MTKDEAITECRRYISYLDRQREKAAALGRLAASVRHGEIDRQDASRRLKAIDCGITVYDGANLENAIKVLIDAPKEEA